MALVRGGFAVQPWTQAFVDEADRVTGIHSFGTYRNHGASKADPDGDPSINVDCFVDPSRRDIGDAFCEWAMANYKRLGVDYIIYQRRIWNPEINVNWRPYNGPSPHTDHVHVTLTPTAPPGSQPGDDMPLNDADKKWLRDEILGILRAPEFNVPQVRASVQNIEGDRINRLIAGLTAIDKKLDTGGGTVDYEKLAKAVNDDAAKRMKD